LIPVNGVYVVNTVSLFKGSAMKTILVLVLISALLAITGCGALGPSDAELAAAQAVIDQAQAVADAAQAANDQAALDDAQVALEQAKDDLVLLQEARAQADKNAGSLASLIGMFSPWAGTALAALYAATQRVRAKSKASALAATMQGIEEFRSVGGPEAVSALISRLKAQHDAAGVRAAIKTSLAQLRLKSA
jgi:predicted small lipoprotein YifL